MQPTIMTHVCVSDTPVLPGDSFDSDFDSATDRSSTAPPLACSSTAPTGSSGIPSLLLQPSGSSPLSRWLACSPMSAGPVDADAKESCALSVETKGAGEGTRGTLLGVEAAREGALAKGDGSCLGWGDAPRSSTQGGMLPVVGVHVEGRQWVAAAASEHFMML